MAELPQFNLLTLPRNLLMFQLPLRPLQSLSVCLGDVLQYVCLRRHGLKMFIPVLPQIALVLLVAVIRNARSSSFACTLTPGGNALPHHATLFPPHTHLHSTMNTHTQTHTDTIGVLLRDADQPAGGQMDRQQEEGKIQASRLDPEACCTNTNVCQDANENGGENLNSFDPCWFSVERIVKSTSEEQDQQEWLHISQMCVLLTSAQFTDQRLQLHLRPQGGAVQYFHRFWCEVMS